MTTYSAETPFPREEGESAARIQQFRREVEAEFTRVEVRKLARARRRAKRAGAETVNTPWGPKMLVRM